MLRGYFIWGELLVGDKVVPVRQGAHADDLPDDADAARAEMTERVRRHIAAMYGDPDAPWQSVQVFDSQVIPDEDVPPEVRAFLG